MSSSSYCQGLQSCLEPPHSRLVEPRVSRVELSPPKSNYSVPAAACRSSFFTPRKLQPSLGANCESKSSSSSNVDMGGWSFLQSLSVNNKNNKEDKIYVPPSVKRSSSMLSAKSLEMCTERLGSETGSDSSSADEMTTCPFSSDNINKRLPNYFPQASRGSPYSSVAATIPPPLTSTNVQLRPHREGGRLVLEAVALTSCQTYFQAERTNGRLRLHMMNKCDQKEAAPPASTTTGLDDHEKPCNIEAALLFEEEAGNESDEDADDECWREELKMELELEENSGKGGGEIGMGKLARSSRCMEGGSESKALLNSNNWEKFWLAT